MLLDLILGAGQVLGVVALLHGAYLALMETEPFSSLFGRKSAAALSLLPRDLRLIGGLGSSGTTDHSLSANGMTDTQYHGLSDSADDLPAAIQQTAAQQSAPLTQSPLPSGS